MKFWWYPEKRWFFAAAIVAFLFALSAFTGIVIVLAWLALSIWLIVSLAESLLLLFKKPQFDLKRTHSKLLSLGSENRVYIKLKNNGSYPVYATLIDELPYGFEPYIPGKSIRIEPNELKQFAYSLRPLKRGLFDFGYVQLYVQVGFRLISRRMQLATPDEVKVFPSLIHMQEMQLINVQGVAQREGLKKRRQVGEGYEFEEIRTYVAGDDFRKINWKATARTTSLMTNQFKLERSQNVYMLVDSGRSMYMPFNGLSLLDHSINSALALANIVHRNHDLPGLLSFDADIKAYVPPNLKGQQIQLMANELYHIEPSLDESDFECLYAHIQRHVTHRSVLMLFTNFETRPALERVIPILRLLARKHVLLVVFFENSELVSFSRKRAQNKTKVYDQLIAENKLLKKVLLSEKLKKYGIHTLITPPEKLSIQVINEYFSLRAGGLV
jgi:uncharacterized protein (DUF58 family)